ncbi:hypothetical protein [Shewanella sp.]|uniref:hypothetical protein n=1 Tax=Shewanella sp. TaxID=50422 RepID=UPI001EC7DA51|nr:hypothetical protein [Shewanella sp.]NRB24762.1 hypothetical protein [Shewanella sp.]
MQEFKKDKGLDMLTDLELQKVNGGAIWLGHLDRFERHQNELRYGYQTGGSGALSTCDRID